VAGQVTPVEADDGVQGLSYQAASPDEVAIVKWAESVGLSLVRRDLSSVALRSTAGVSFEFDILAVFPFTSESKRMVGPHALRTGALTPGPASRAHRGSSCATAARA
jgi:magnesium-transporting ATPase (P-type)